MFFFSFYLKFYLSSNYIFSLYFIFSFHHLILKNTILFTK